MNKKNFWLGFWLILVLAFLQRIIPLRNNNFYFTMDQGNDAVHVREIWFRGQLLLLGPETGLPGLFAGPLWYYFIGFGYFLFGGHPFGGLLMVILLNVSLVGIVMTKIKKEVSSSWAIFVGACLQTSWWFYDTSRYAFNPFPLVFLAFMLIFSLIDFLAGKEKGYLWAAVFVGLGFNTEVAGSMAFAFFLIFIGLWSVIKKRSSWKNIFLGWVIVGLFFVPHLLSETSSGFSQTHTLLNEIGNPNGIFSERTFAVITPRFLTVVSRSILRQVPEIGFLSFTLIVLLVFKKWGTKRKINSFTKRFVSLSLALLIISWLWFSSNKGWQDWQTVYLSPLIFVSFLLLLHELKKEIALALFLVSLISHLLIMKDRYLEYLHPKADPSLLTNELQAIDWVYQESGGKGFYVYSYLPSVLDYPYQYLFWWYGRQKYGYLPCEYASFPNAPGLFVPNKKYYERPQKPCTDLRFLIIEPDENTINQDQWLSAISQNTKLLEATTVGQIKVEKRLILK